MAAQPQRTRTGCVWNFKLLGWVCDEREWVEWGFGTRFYLGEMRQVVLDEDQIYGLSFHTPSDSTDSNY